MQLDPQTLYIQLGRLIETMPSLAPPLSADAHTWVGRAYALIESMGNPLDTAEMNVAVSGIPRGRGDHPLLTVLYRALAKAELAAPASAQGAFIAVGADLDAFAAIGKVLSQAKTDVLIVDPYLDATTLTDFAPSTSEGVTVRLLSDQASCKPTLLSPAAKRWMSQYGNARPLEVRLTAPRQLHDRLIILDRKQVSVLTQSLKDFAGRSPASIIRATPDIAELKVAAYESLWTATPLLP